MQTTQSPMPGAIEGDQAAPLYSVSQLARQLGVTARTIRFYEDKHLINPQRAGTTRVYTHRDRARLVLILRGKRLGFSLREIKEFLDLYDADPQHHLQTRNCSRACASASPGCRSSAPPSSRASSNSPKSTANAKPLWPARWCDANRRSQNTK